MPQAGHLGGYYTTGYSLRITCNYLSAATRRRAATMMPWTRHKLVRWRFINSARECFVHVEGLMGALERALKREDQDAIAAARETIKQSALKIEVRGTDYRIQVLQPVLDPTMVKIGAAHFANVPLGTGGELDTWAMPINAYV